MGEKNCYTCSFTVAILSAVIICALSQETYSYSSDSNKFLCTSDFIVLLQMHKAKLENAATRKQSQQKNSDNNKRFKTLKTSDYYNEKFGFYITYPIKFFSHKTYSDAGDGITLYNDNHTLELKAYGSWYGNTIQEVYFDELKWAKESGEIITYTVIRKKWFVISGINKKNKSIMYEKIFFSNGMSTAFRLVYPIKSKSEYDGLVKFIGRNFKNYMSVR